MSLPPPTPSLTSRPRDPNHIPRPPNSFILFRSSRARVINQQSRFIEGIGVRAANLSRQLAEEWRDLPEVEKQTWREKAEIQKRLHAEAYPDYKYCPMKGAHKSKKTRKEKNKTPAVNNTLSGGAMQGSPHIDSNPPNLNDATPYIAYPYCHCWDPQCPTYFSAPANQSPLLFPDNPLEFLSRYEMAGGTFTGHSS